MVLFFSLNIIFQGPDDGWFLRKRCLVNFLAILSAETWLWRFLSCSWSSQHSKWASSTFRQVWSSPRRRRVELGSPNFPPGSILRCQVQRDPWEAIHYIIQASNEHNSLGQAKRKQTGVLSKAATLIKTFISLIYSGVLWFRFSISLHMIFLRAWWWDFTRNVAQ